MTGLAVLLSFALAAPRIGLSAQSAAQGETSLYTRVTLCGISFHHERANPKHISVDAEYVSAIPHGLFLIDRRCEGKGLQIDFADNGLDPSVAFIKHHMFEIHRAHGIFRGTLKRGRVNGRLYLWLESVADFRSDDIHPAPHEDEPIHLPEPPLPTWPPTL